jgi:hypothetical protein
VSNTGGHGRGGQGGRIIGDVINHGKHQYAPQHGQRRRTPGADARAAVAPQVLG